MPRIKGDPDKLLKAFASPAGKAPPPLEKDVQKAIVGWLSAWGRWPSG